MTFAAVGAYIAANAVVIGAAAVAAVGAYASAQSTKHAAEYNAEVDKQRMDVAAQQGAANEDASRRRSGMVLGREAAALADSGTGLAGAHADVYQQSATAAELDALNERYKGKLGFIGAQDQNQLDSMSASAAERGGWFNAGAAALSSYGSYARFSRGLNTTGLS